MLFGGGGIELKRSSVGAFRVESFVLMRCATRPSLGLSQCLCQIHSGNNSVLGVKSHIRHTADGIFDYCQVCDSRPRENDVCTFIENNISTLIFNTK